MAGPALLGAVAAGWLSWVVAGHFHDKEIEDLNRAHEAALDKQETDLINACQARQAISYGVSYGYQNDRDIINGALSYSLSDNTAPSCIMPIATETSRCDSQASGPTNVPAKAGISVAWLKRIMAEADETTAQLNRCVDFVNETWGLYDQ